MDRDRFARRRLLLSATGRIGIGGCVGVRGVRRDGAGGCARLSGARKRNRLRAGWLEYSGNGSGGSLRHGDGGDLGDRLLGATAQHLPYHLVREHLCEAVRANEKNIPAQHIHGSLLKLDRLGQALQALLVQQDFYARLVFVGRRRSFN